MQQILLPKQQASKIVSRARYAAHLILKCQATRLASKVSYAANPVPKHQAFRIASKVSYGTNPGLKHQACRLAARVRYKSMPVLKKDLASAYYRRKQCWRGTAFKAYYERRKEFICINHRARADLQEPKETVKAECICELQYKMLSTPKLQVQLSDLFIQKHAGFASQMLKRAVASTVFRYAAKTLMALQQRKRSASQFLTCACSVITLMLSADDTGERYRTACSEPLFHDSSCL